MTQYSTNGVNWWRIAIKHLRHGFSWLYFLLRNQTILCIVDKNDIWLNKFKSLSFMYDEQSEVIKNVKDNFWRVILTTISYKYGKLLQNYKDMYQILSEVKKLYNQKLKKYKIIMTLDIHGTFTSSEKAKKTFECWNLDRSSDGLVSFSPLFVISTVDSIASTMTWLCM